MKEGRRTGSINNWEGNMSKRLWILHLACLLWLYLIAAVPVASSGDLPKLDAVSFLSGHWVGTSRGIEMEELWLEPKGGMMLGLHRDVAQGRETFFEYLRIEDRGGELVYIASPKGSGAIEFPLVEIRDGVVVFENLEHDYPQRIIYRREGDSVTARIEGVIDGSLEAAEWSWFKAR